MTALSDNTTADEAFFAPLNGLAAASPNRRRCRELSDDRWLRLYIHRALEAAPSGRGFLQEHAPRLGSGPARSDYFVSINSERSSALARGVNLALIAARSAWFCVAAATSRPYANTSAPSGENGAGSASPPGAELRDPAGAAPWAAVALPPCSATWRTQGRKNSLLDR